MERLNKKYSNGYGGFEYLAHPNEDIPMQLKIFKAFEKLGKLEDLEEQIGMPLEVFIKVLFEEPRIWSIKQNTISMFCFDEFRDGEFLEKEYSCGCHYGYIGISPTDYGKSWFLTREEAEKKLEEMKNEVM